MSTRFLGLAAVGVLATVTSAGADTLKGTYTAVDTVTGTYAPTINDDGGPFLNSPFSETLTVGTPVATTFMQVNPITESSSVGTKTGSVAIAMTLTGPGGSALKSVSYSAGGNGATLTNGSIDFDANYEIFYGNQTDCLTWNSTTCTANNSTTTVGETLTATFANGSVLKMALYNWSDWAMAPEISFDEVSGAAPSVPEPASIAVLGTGLLAFGLGMRRRRGDEIKSGLTPQS